ncbi:leucine-rich repeat-containing protein 15-like isoform X2 [Actinia tenebrosa]|uniref:Leucine-rich repeat-containing protein 15-like isoform X2 n=1 Tax=Actinia tenebrosa TaxID=6105 RepID=A0A6P8J513_ACTTE|nr:leucine-rich repeat-containing protein 15-like isoform X2 [Actinia tenebrosa]
MPFVERIQSAHCTFDFRNLSGNNIKEIPPYSFSDYEQLLYLSLSSNKIQIISKRAFNGLPRLRELNLQDNMIKQWDTTLIEQDLPNLLMLNIAQNIYWKPDQQILSLPNLKIIFLLLAFLPRKQSEISSYFHCYIARNNANISNTNNTTFIQQLPKSIHEKVEPDFITHIPDNCWLDELIFQDPNYRGIIDKSGFHFHCETVQPKSLLEKHKRLTNFTQPQQKEWFY